MDDLLNKQSTYKEYFYNCLFTSWTSTIVKFIIAFLLSLGFDALELFSGYTLLISYLLVEVLNYNLFSKEQLKP